MDISSIMPIAIDVSGKIKAVKEAQYNFRRGSKQNFNFFSAIVTGKHDKEHIEKYHSNFISYLLNPEAPHDCGIFFLKKFIKELEKKKNEKFKGNVPNPDKLENVSVEREKIAEEGYIDIAIESKSDWFIFIENKVESDEGYQQVKYYCDWAHGKKPDMNWCGVYLTKYGIPPKTIHGSDHENKVISLSYHDIIEWLESCQKEKEIINYPHIISALTQYINVIKKNLGIMGDTEKTEIQSYFKKDRIRTALLAQNFTNLTQELEEYIKLVRTDFLDELKDKIIEQLKDKGVDIQYENDELRCSNPEFVLLIKQSYPKYDETGRGLWWGIKKNKDGSRFEHNLKLDKKWWEGVVFKEIDDFENDTDNGSAKIIESIDNVDLRGQLIEEISKTITNKTKHIAEELEKINMTK
jgi:hypothetical protein